MPRTTDETVWLRTEFAFGAGDPCDCYKECHRTKNGNPKRCDVRSVVIGLKHPDRPESRMRLFCLDCWAWCRTEQTASNRPEPEPGFGLISIGC